MFDNLYTNCWFLKVLILPKYFKIKKTIIQVQGAINNFQHFHKRTKHMHENGSSKSKCMFCTEKSVDIVFSANFFFKLFFYLKTNYAPVSLAN